jgi:SAM-dependent methyltransferase
MKVRVKVSGSEGESVGSYRRRRRRSSALTAGLWQQLAARVTFTFTFTFTVSFTPRVSQLRGDYKSVWNSLSGSKEEAYHYVAGYTDEDKFHADAEDTLDILRDTVGVKPDDTFLEIGCGVGRVGRVLSPFIKEWIGCDVSANMLRLAGRRLLGLTNVRLVEISGYDLNPIPDASVDVVYTTVVFMHLEEWDRYNYILEAKRVLKPGGRIYCDNVDLASARGWAVFEESRLGFPPSQRPSQISKCSTQPEIEEFLKHAGFSEVRVQGRLDFWVYGWGVKAK